MSLAEDLATTARVLCKIAITRSSTQLRCDELDYALTAKRGLVQLLSLVHDTAQRQPWNRVPTARPTHDLLTRDPVAALGQALRVCPTPDSPLAPSDLPLRDHHTPAGLAWSTIGRTVLSAHRQWDTGTTTLTDDQAWSAVADVAAVAAVLDTIDPDLARAAKHHKRPHVAAELSSRGHHLDTARAPPSP